MSQHKTKIGELFVIGFPGATPPPEFLDFVRERQIGGVILFEENCGSSGDVRASVDAIRDLYDRTTPLIAIDQEGGRVCRLRGAPAEFKAPSDYSKGRGVEQYTEDYRRAAVCMQTLGINLNLAPVVDLYLNEGNLCLAERCFGSTVDEITPYVRATIKTSRAAGLLSCAKHFPGLGAAEVDPHKATTTAEYDLDTWYSREMQAFKAAIDAGVDMVMTTHIQLPLIDKAIATGSDYILKHMLRDMLSFEGPVITDDLTMEGAAALGDIGKRAVMAIQAGHDLLLFGRDYKSAMTAFEAVSRAVDQGTISPETIHRAHDRVTSIKCKLARPVAI